jgi:hypothetical protein
MINNLMSIVSQDLGHHAIAHIFTDTHPSTAAFLAGRGKWAVVIMSRKRNKASD